MTVDEQVGFDVEHVADYAFDRMAPAVDLGADRRDHHAATTVDHRGASRALHPMIDAREHVVEFSTGAPMTSLHGWERAAHQAAVADALQALGITRLNLAIHDASFPAGADDPGRG